MIKTNIAEEEMLKQYGGNPALTLIQYSAIVHPIVGDKPSKADLAQWVAFVVSVWNACVVFQVTGDSKPTLDICNRIQAMQATDTHAAVLHGAVMREIIDRKMHENRNASWLYSDSDVYVDGDSLRVTAEVWTFGQWQASGKNLTSGRMN